MCLGPQAALCGCTVTQKTQADVFSVCRAWVCSFVRWLVHLASCSQQQSTTCNPSQPGQVKIVSNSHNRVLASGPEADSEPSSRDFCLVIWPFASESIASTRWEAAGISRLLEGRQFESIPWKLAASHAEQSAQETLSKHSAG